MFPHEYLEAYLREHLGRRHELFGPVSEDLFRPLVLGVSDQLSAYNDVRPYARFRMGDATVREGKERSYLILGLMDRSGPLRMHEAIKQFDMEVTNRPEDFVWDVNARRWRFVERWLSRFFEPMLRKAADALAEYYTRRPYAVPTAGLCRFMEGVDRTHLVIEMDDRGGEPEPGTPDTPGRYRVQ